MVLGRGWFWVRSLLSAILLLTATAKVLDAAQILGSGAILASTWRLTLVVGLEMFAAVLIALAPDRIAHRSALILFSSMACIAAWAWWTQADCGCFGSQTPAGVPLVVDLVAVGMLVACRKRVPGVAVGSIAAMGEHGILRYRLRNSICVAVAAGLLTGGIAYYRTDALATREAMPAWFGENLIGSTFPLLSDERFASCVPALGDALIVMLRPDCDHCREVATAWKESRQNESHGLVVIGVSVSEDGWTVMPSTVSVTPTGSKTEFSIQWQESEEPFIAAPTFLALRDQIVIIVATGENASEIIRTNSLTDQLFGASATKDIGVKHP